LLTAADERLDLLAQDSEIDVHGTQRRHRGALTLVDDAEQYVLGADVVVLQ
jgi:hypothetical protein